MCWKHEWAKAINNLEWAKIHIERAKLKVDKRGLTVAAGMSDRLLEILDETQDILKDMIETYGISMKEQAPSMLKHMKGRRQKSGKIVEWGRKN